jgi:hypothetical protein
MASEKGDYGLSFVYCEGRGDGNVKGLEGGLMHGKGSVVECRD